MGDATGSHRKTDAEKATVSGFYVGIASLIVAVIGVIVAIIAIPSNQTTATPPASAPVTSIAPATGIASPLQLTSPPANMQPSQPAVPPLYLSTIEDLPSNDDNLERTAVPINGKDYINGIRFETSLTNREWFIQAPPLVQQYSIFGAVFGVGDDYVYDSSYDRSLKAATCRFQVLVDGKSAYQVTVSQGHPSPPVQLSVKGASILKITLNTSGYQSEYGSPYPCVIGDALLS